MAEFKLTINRKKMVVNAEADTPLLWVLRDQLGLNGTKYGCGKGLCGACTVHVDGKAVRSCSLPISAVESSRITTIEGVSSRNRLHKVQRAWIDEDVPQCGYCQAGQIMSAIALLEENSSPSNQEIEAAMSGNICRCGTYPRIKKAIAKAAGQR